MNLTSFNHYPGGYIVVEGDIDPMQIRAIGSANSPVLTLPLKLLYRPPSDQSSTDLIFTLLTGAVHVALPEGDRIRLGIIDPTPINRFVGATASAGIPEPRDITMTLDPRILDAIERKRVKDVQLYAELQMSVLVWGQAPPYMKPKPTDSPRLGQSLTLSVSLAPVISQSAWIENVLKPSKHGEVRLIEIPFGQISTTPLLFKSMSALEKAERFLKTGDYDEAAGLCRVALEGYFVADDPADPANKKQVLKKEWRKTLGEATYGWLNTILRSIKADTNAPHHHPSAHFSRMDAQMLITITAVVLSYIERQVRTSHV